MVGRLVDDVGSRHRVPRRQVHRPGRPQLLVNQGRAVPRSLRGGEDRRQLLVVHVDKGQRLQRPFLIRRRSRGHGLADVAHLVHGEDLLVLDGVAVAPLRHVPRRDHGDPRERPGLLHVDGPDPRMRQRAAQDLAPQHPRLGHVRPVDGLPRDHLGTVRAYDRCADYAIVVSHVVCSVRSIEPIRGRGSSTAPSWW